MRYPCTPKQTGQTILNAVRGLSGGECVIAALHASMKFLTHKKLFCGTYENLKICCHIVASPTEKVVWPYSTYSYVQNINHFTTHFSSSNDLFCFSALARAMAPVLVRPLFLRLQWGIIRHEHTWVRSILKIPCFCCYGNDNSSPPEKPLILVWAPIGKDTITTELYMRL